MERDTGVGNKRTLNIMTQTYEETTMKSMVPYANLKKKINEKQDVLALMDSRQLLPKYHRNRKNILRIYVE